MVRDDCTQRVFVNLTVMVGCVIHIHFFLQIRILDTIMVVEEMKLQAVINGLCWLHFLFSFINKLWCRFYAGCIFFKE